jgi:aminobenzoyl-glutamate utilization protein B
LFRVTYNMSEKVKQTAINWVEQNKQLLIDAHMKIWGWAELGLQELKSANLLINILKKNEFKVEEGVAGMPSAFVATYGTGKPVIGVMGELDALPSVSNKAVPYREPVIEGGPGHGCGHNSYAATSLGGGLALRIAMDEHKIPGTIKIFGCPAEETLIGKVFMVRDGYFDGLDACLGHHPGSMNTARLSSGNAMNSVKFEFFGKASHAAGSPERGISAMDAVELMNIGVNYMREHVVQETRIHYIVEDGGKQPNVVPPYARTWYYVRAPRRDLVEEYYDWVLRIADGADQMARTTHNVQFLSGVHNGMPNRPLAELIVANMREIGAPTYNEEELEFAKKLGETVPHSVKMNGLYKLAEILPGALELENVDLVTKIFDPYGEAIKGGGSSDVADVAWNTPTQQFSTTYFVLGCPGHSWQHTAVGGTSIGQKSTIFASKVMALTAIDLMMNPKFIKAAKEDWETRMKGLNYKSPLPPGQKPPVDQLPSTPD